MRIQILEALKADAKGNIEKARLNIEIYLKNPVGIGSIQMFSLLFKIKLILLPMKKSVLKY